MDTLANPYLQCLLCSFLAHTAHICSSPGQCHLSTLVKHVFPWALPPLFKHAGRSLCQSLPAWFALLPAPRLELSFRQTPDLIMSTSKRENGVLVYRFGEGGRLSSAGAVLSRAHAVSWLLQANPGTALGPWCGA